MSSLLRSTATSRVNSSRQSASTAQTYGVAMGTAERALTLLRDEGLIIMVIGRGAFVNRSHGTPG